MVEFNCTLDEMELVSKIVDRAVGRWTNIDRMSLMMDLEATHSNGCELEFRLMLKADDYNLSHDIFGIMKHIDRETGELTDCFIPRFSA